MIFHNISSSPGFISPDFGGDCVEICNFHGSETVELPKNDNFEWKNKWPRKIKSDGIAKRLWSRLLSVFSSDEDNWINEYNFKHSNYTALGVMKFTSSSSRSRFNSTRTSVSCIWCTSKQQTEVEWINRKLYGAEKLTEIDFFSSSSYPRGWKLFQTILSAANIVKELQTFHQLLLARKFLCYRLRRKKELKIDFHFRRKLPTRRDN